MKITKRQLKRIIKEVTADGWDRRLAQSRADQSAAHPDAPRNRDDPFTQECFDALDLLIGKGNAQGMSFPDVIGQIQECLDQLASEGW